MTVHAPSHNHNWEYQLLSLAREAFHAQRTVIDVKTDALTLEAAYRHCDALTRFHSKTFYLASGLLPEKKRRATRALYSFCRITDNLVDTPDEHAGAQAALENWRRVVTLPQPPTDDPIALAWADAQLRFNIPTGYAQQLIDGVRQDFSRTRYNTFSELAEYSYGVASTVGLMAMHIIGFSGDDAIPFAIKLGIALQLTNILRDVAEDWRNGRLYLPLEELAAHGLSETDIANSVAFGCYDNRWRELMSAQIDRARQLYRESAHGIRLLNSDGRFAIAAAARLYEAILDRIEAADYDVFSGRASVSLLGKVRRLPGIWWQAVK
ncbi:MAG: phytoene/squalene synthase family protein [Anaerolineae bacterium]|nr:phytoene/squalene synthase family protein [Anaerolineae bacterium]